MKVFHLEVYEHVTKVSDESEPTSLPGVPGRRAAVVTEMFFFWISPASWVATFAGMARTIARAVR